MVHDTLNALAVYVRTDLQLSKAFYVLIGSLERHGLLFVLGAKPRHRSRGAATRSCDVSLNLISVY
jgi:hypothetical protein